ncbi:MAG: hypothetical protein ACOCV4_01785 [Myxococcota bacterium]
MPKNMVTRRVNDVLILRETKETPSDAEWDYCLELLVQDPQRLDQVKVLVVTDGGGPTPDQRKRLKQTLDGARIPIAVVTDSMRVRFIVSSVALLTSRIQSFAPNQMADAYTHLELSASTERLVQQALAEMWEELQTPVQPRA